MSILGFLGDVFKPAAKLIDDLHTSDEEKLKLRNQFEKMQMEMKSKVLSYEQDLMKAQSSVIQSESNGKSWMQRNWRPITMLTFLALVVCDSFGILAFRLSVEAWALLKIGLGGYVVGRSAEKIAPAVSEALKKKR